jgi:hypothetical protein
MTKADRIRQLAKHGVFTTGEIATIVAKEFGSCLSEYVRTCARQRVPGGRDPNKAWMRRNPEKTAGYKSAWYHRQKAKREASTCPHG